MGKNHMLESRGATQRPDISSQDTGHGVGGPEVHYEPEHWSLIVQKLAGLDHSERPVQERLPFDHNRLFNRSHQTSCMKLTSYFLPLLFRGVHLGGGDVLWHLILRQQVRHWIFQPGPQLTLAQLDEWDTGPIPGWWQTRQHLIQSQLLGLFNHFSMIRDAHIAQTSPPFTHVGRPGNLLFHLRIVICEIFHQTPQPVICHLLGFAHRPSMDWSLSTSSTPKKVQQRDHQSMPDKETNAPHLLPCLLLIALLGAPCSRQSSEFTSLEQLGQRQGQKAPLPCPLCADVWPWLHQTLQVAAKGRATPEGS